MSIPTTLLPEELVFVGICDLAAQVRGKSIPLSDFKERSRDGVGYTPANICLSVFGSIGPSPFGTLGDILLLPDTSTEVHVPMPHGTPEHFCLSDIISKDGEKWPFCPRDFLRRALERLKNKTGCTLLASFEQEFVYTGISAEPRRGYALASFREQDSFGALLVAALRTAGMVPDTFLPEFGPQQFEITVAPASGLRAADQAIALREITRALARQSGHRALFSPMLQPEGVGNGTHIHLSLRDHAGDPATQDTNGSYGLSTLAEQFMAGILDHMPALTAVTVPSVCSYYRLTPDRWAPTWANISSQDRAASLRICPGSASQFNVEYRVADATACPYMALGALVHAGVDGIERQLSLPQYSSTAFADMASAQRRASGMQPLPRTLGEALDHLRATPAAPSWFGSEFFELYLNFKRQEEQSLADLNSQAICDRYAAVF